MNLTSKNIFPLLTLVVLLSLSVGFLIGFVSKSAKKIDQNELSYYKSLIRDYDPKGIDNVIKEVNAESIRKYLKNITFLPHQGGTEMDKKSADYIIDSFKEFGLDHYDIFEYDVLLDYPDENKFNKYFLIFF